MRLRARRHTGSGDSAGIAATVGGHGPIATFLPSYRPPQRIGVSVRRPVILRAHQTVPAGPRRRRCGDVRAFRSRTAADRRTRDIPAGAVVGSPLPDPRRAFSPSVTFTHHRARGRRLFPQAPAPRPTTPPDTKPDIRLTQWLTTTPQPHRHAPG